MDAQRDIPAHRPATTGGPHRGRRRALGWLLVLPFLLFSLIGQGTMLAAGPDNRLTVVLCSGEGLVDMVVAVDGSLIPADEDRPDPHHDNPVCDWAIHAQSAPGPAAATAPLPHLLLQPARHAPHVALHERRIAVLAPAARGPPLPV